MAKNTLKGRVIIGGIERFLEGEYESQLVVDPDYLYTDSSESTSVTSAPESVGSIESAVEGVGWFQDVSVDRPEWDQITRNGETVNVLKFDGLGQELKVDFPEAVSGTMVIVTSNGNIPLEVDIPAGIFSFGDTFDTSEGWDVEEVILLDRTLSDVELENLQKELDKTRNRIITPTKDVWVDLFRDKTYVTDPSRIDFSNAIELFRVFADSGVTTVTSGLFKNATNLVEIRDCFHECNISSIPEDLFSDCPNLNRLGGEFYRNNLTTIPENILSNNPLLETILGSLGYYVFLGLFQDNNIQSIPENIFANNTELTGIYNTFRGNSITSIPENLFANQTKLVDAFGVFSRNNITSIPENLFANCPLFEEDGVRSIGGVYRMYGLFAKNDITSIPENLFANNPELRKLVYTFAENDISAIPPNLFANNSKLEVLEFTFHDNLITSIPETLFNNCPLLTTVSGQYRNQGQQGGVFSFNQITSIPENLFANNSDLVNVRGTFRNNPITSIPENLFANNPLLENVGTDIGRYSANTGGCFQELDISSIPAGLFSNNPNITNCGETFKANPNLTSVPSGLFSSFSVDDRVGFYRVFQDCVSLASVPSGLFDTQTKCTRYEDAFNNCALDQTSVDNVLVSVQTSADANNLDNGTLGIDGGTNATPSQTGKDAADALRARGWTVNLNGY